MGDPFFERLERFDSNAPTRNALREIAVKKGEWAGIPLPLESMPLIVEPSYPAAHAFKQESKRDPELDKIKIRNTFWSHRYRCDITIYQEESGEIGTYVTPGVNHLKFDLNTMAASDAWGIEQESQALATLSNLLRHRMMKSYLLTGAFVETSCRSGVSYIFRRLKPTIAISTREGKNKILAALCLHPIAYYQESWAGAMCPTDDVIAHLMLMRGDERMFWRRANHHAPHRPEACL